MSPPRFLRVARRVSGAWAVERYGGADVAALVAAELALWALVARAAPEPRIF